MRYVSAGKFELAGLAFLDAVDIEFVDRGPRLEAFRGVDLPQPFARRF